MVLFIQALKSLPELRPSASLSYLASHHRSMSFTGDNSSNREFSEHPVTKVTAKHDLECYRNYKSLE